MRYRFYTGAVMVVAMSILGGVTTAEATIIGASPNINFTNSSTSFAIGNAGYSLSNDTSQFNPLSVATSGSAQVSLFGTPPNAPHKPGGIADGQSLPTFQGPLGTQHYSFDSFADATPSPSFNFFGPYLGLKFMLDDGIHYGYAKISNSDTLIDYAYNSVVGEGIVTGAPIEQQVGGTAVPEPSPLAPLGLGLCLIAALTWRRSRSSRSASGC